MPKRGLVALRVIVSAAIALACASAGVPDHGARETGRLFFWEVESPDGAGGSAHLLGSVHFGRPDFHFDPAILGAFERSDALVMELGPDDVSPEKMTALLMRLGRSPGGETLSELLSPETYDALADALQRSGYAIANLEPFEPWVAITVLTSLAFQSAGLFQEHGVEAHFLERAGATKEITGLETPEQQMALFDAMPLHLQETILRELVSDDDALRLATDAVLEAWLRGDTERLAEVALTGSHQDEGARAFYEALYWKRNREMARGIAELIDRGGEWFVVVGAAHMVGAGGIPALLAERGYAVRQIEKTR